MDAVPHDDRDALRASDQDRNRVAEQLHGAAAEGRITLDELGERLETLYAARTYGELAPLTRDLPGAAVARTGAVVPVTAAGVPANGPSVSIGIMGAGDRSGEWLVPAEHTAIAVMGGVSLDLTRAQFAAPQVTVYCLAIMGGIEVIVPADLSVEVNGFAFMGGFDRKGAGIRSGGPTVKITGFALMGGVEVKRAKPRKELNPGG